MLQIGIISTGGIAIDHVERLLETGEVHIRAVSNRGELNRNILLSKFGLTETLAFDNHVDMLNQVELDAVVICSPPGLHFQQAMDALNRGLHVMVEKPMTRTAEEARQLVAKAEEVGKILQVAYQRHFRSGYVYIKQAIESGTIGKIVSVAMTKYQDWRHPEAAAWQTDPALSGGGAVMDHGTHGLEAMLWMSGLKPLEVKTTLSTWGMNVENDSYSSVLFEGGAVGGINIGGYTPFSWETYAFCGEKGALFYNDGKVSLRRIDEPAIYPELPQVESNVDKSFVDAILGRCEVAIPGIWGVRAMELTEMIYAAGGYNPQAYASAGNLS